MNKIVIFAFRGDPMCFVHVLLNGLDLAKRDLVGTIIIEGDAVQLIPEMAKPDHFLNQLYTKAKTQGIIAGACRACSTKLGVVETVQKEGIELIGDMSGHPAMSDYITQGYTVISL